MKARAIFDCFQCSQCSAIGTLRKYHAIPEAPERWLCKWCGYYWSEKLGQRQCVPDPESGVWQFKEGKFAEMNLQTPRERWPEAHKWLLHAMGTEEA